MLVNLRSNRAGYQSFQTSRRQTFQGSYRHRPSARGSVANLLDQASRPSKHLSSYERLPGVRSRSPYPFVTGPRGPKYRPVSPAYSESQASYPRPPYGVSCGHGYRSPSPLSTYSQDRTPPDWHTRTKHWEARQVQNGEARPTMLDGHSPLDPAVSKTYAPDHRTHLRNAEAYITPPTRPPPGSWPIEEWLPSPPLFYDYSEEF